jgi:uncharacterized membrane protein (DUF106 family)
MYATSETGLLRQLQESMDELKSEFKTFKQKKDPSRLWMDLLSLADRLNY